MENFTRGQIQEAIAGTGPVEAKVMTLAGGTTNDPGDENGTGNPADLFTITGMVQVKLFAIITTDLVGATATIKIGLAGDTAALIAQTTATDMDENEIWHDGTPDKALELSTVITEKIITKDIIQTVATANITAGVIKYYCMWKPISLNGKVIAA